MRQRESTSHYTNKDNKYLFTRSASSGCLLISLLHSANQHYVRPISACGKGEGKQKKNTATPPNALMIQKIMNGSWLWQQHFAPCLRHLDTGMATAGNEQGRK